MAVTVRFASGLALTYNRGRWVEAWGPHSCTIRNKKGGNLLAMVPHDAVIEWVTPCLIEEPGTQALVRAANSPALLRELPPSILRRLKMELSAFNRQTGTWK